MTSKQSHYFRGSRRLIVMLLVACCLYSLTVTLKSQGRILWYGQLQPLDENMELLPLHWWHHKVDDMTFSTYHNNISGNHSLADAVNETNDNTTQQIDAISVAATSSVSTVATTKYAELPIRSQTVLTFWSRATVSNSHAFIVTRMTDGFHEVVPAVFRRCVDEHSYKVAADNATLTLDRCPVSKSALLHKHPVFDNTTVLVISIDQTALQPSQTKRRPTCKSFVAITYSDQAFQQHIPFLMEHSPKQGIDAQYLQIRSCDGHDCPKNCAVQMERRRSSYPYYWDPEDYLCKSQHPEVLERYRGSSKIQNNSLGGCSCATACFTPEAVDDVPAARVWPWKSAEQRAWFHNDDPTLQERIRNDEKKATKTRQFQENYSSYQPRFDCQHDELSIRPNHTIPLSIYGSFQHHLMFVPEAKLIFCGVPKAGITEWMKFFRFVAGAKDYLAVPHYKRDRNEFFVKSLPIEKATELLLDPSWTKAVIFRDPAERLLSAYLDKVVNNGYTQHHFQINATQDTTDRSILTFEEFVDLVTMLPKFVNGTLVPEPPGHGLHGHTDPHWRPQSMMCGLDYLLPYFDFVGNFRYVSEHSKLLLERVGLWDNYGAKFDSAKDGHSKGSLCTQTVLSRDDAGFNVSRIVHGFNQNGVSGKQLMTHTRNSKLKLNKYYTPDLMSKVRRAFQMDYGIFDELQDRAEKHGSSYVASGASFSIVQTHCSHKHAKI
jgi:Sulfotransferase family